MLADTVRQMKHDGIRRALGFVTSAYSSYSGCRQYREDIARAQGEVGPEAPQIDKLRAFFNHPGFIAATAARLRQALAEVPVSEQQNIQMVYTARSMPKTMAKTSIYFMQLEDVMQLVSRRLRVSND